MRRGFSAEIATALTTTYAIMVCDDDLVADALARPVPNNCRLLTAVLEVTSINGAGSIVWYIAADALGALPLTLITTTTLTAGAVAAKGSIVGLLDVGYSRSSAGVAGKLYVVAKTDAGTATCKPRITWEEDV